MKKKILSMIVVALLVATFCPLNAFAMENNNEPVMSTRYSDETIVTKDNILKILDDFGIEHSEFIYSNETAVEEYTVGELREALSKVDNEESGKNLIESSKLQTNAAVSTQATSSKTKKISETFDHNGYSLTHSVTVKYKGSSFTDVTGTDISIDSDLLPIVYKITKETENSVSFTKTKVTQTYNIDVSSYVGVKYGLVKIGTSTLNGNVYFHASNWL